MPSSAAPVFPLATFRLQPHPHTPCSVVDEVVVDVAVTAESMLVVRYTIVGGLDRLRIPAVGASLDPDRLWAHTCCELFVAPAQGEGYVEWNFSPSGQLACFAFSAYRTRTLSAPIAVADPSITVAGSELRLEARVPLPPDLGETARVAISTVLEDATGALSYWALRHPRDRPDFHHPDAFTAITLAHDHSTPQGDAR